MLKLKMSLSQLPLVIEVDGAEEEFYLKEMNAAARDRYLDSVSDRVRVDGQGRVAGIKKFAGMQSDLICGCLHFGQGPMKDQLVPKATLQTWPASTISALFNEAQKLNSINEPAKTAEEIEAAEKKD